MSTLDDNCADPYALWEEIVRLRNEVKGPDGFETWKDAAVNERIRRVKAEKELAELKAAKPNFASTAIAQVEAMIEAMSRRIGYTPTIWNLTKLKEEIQKDLDTLLPKELESQ